MAIRRNLAIIWWCISTAFAIGLTAAERTWEFSMTLTIILWVLCGLFASGAVLLSTPFGTTIVLWLQDIIPIIKSDTKNVLSELSKTLITIRQKESHLLSKVIEYKTITLREPSNRCNAFELIKQKRLKIENYNLRRLLSELNDSLLNRLIADEVDQRSFIQSIRITKENTDDFSLELEKRIIELERIHREDIQKIDARIERLRRINE